MGPRAGLCATSGRPHSPGHRSGQFVDKARRKGALPLVVNAPAGGKRDQGATARPGEADIGQAAFFLQALFSFFVEGALVGEQALLEVLNAGTGRSWASENWALIRPVVESPADGSPYPAMARKDCDLALTVAAAAGTSAPIAEAIAERLAELDRAGGIGSQP